MAKCLQQGPGISVGTPSVTIVMAKTFSKRDASWEAGAGPALDSIERRVYGFLGELAGSAFTPDQLNLLPPGWCFAAGGVW